MKECFLNNLPSSSAIATFDGTLVKVDLPPHGLIEGINMEILGNFLLECAEEKEEYRREEVRKEIEKSRPKGTYNRDGSLRVGVHKTDHWYTRVKIKDEGRVEDGELITAMARWCDAMNSIDAKDALGEE